MKILLFDTLADAETALAILAAMGEAALGPNGDGYPIVDQAGERVLIGKRGGVDDFASPGTSLRWADPLQSPDDGRYWFKSLNEKARFRGTNWATQFAAAGGPAFEEIDFPASWLDAAGELKPYQPGG